MSAFSNVAKIRYEGPNQRTRWRSGTTMKRNGRRQVDEGPLSVQRALAHHARHGRRSVWTWHHAAALEARPIRSRTRSTASACVRVFESSALRLLFSRPRRGPGRRHLVETNKNLDAVVKALKEEQQRTGVSLWARPTCSAIRVTCTAPPRVATPTLRFARPVKKALEVTRNLAGGYLLGGREGYQCYGTPT